MIGVERRVVKAVTAPAETSACRCQRGFVLGRRFAGVFFVVLALALGRAGAGFFFADGFAAVVAAAPEETRDECFVRCLVFVGAAASATEDSAHAATRATTSTFSVLRIMRLR